MSNSPYYRTLSQKTDADLKAMIENDDGYEPDAIVVAKMILKERKIDSILEDDSDQESTLKQSEESYEEPHERLFFVNWQAPTIVIMIGFGLYFLLGISFYFTMSKETVITINGRVVFRLLFVLIIYFAFAVMIDAVMKGKVWARAAYASLFALGIMWKFIFYALNPFLFIPTLLEVALTLIELAFVVLLFVPPASAWFVQKRKKKIVQSDDLLDDL